MVTTFTNGHYVRGPRSRSKYSVRPFLATIAFILALALLSFIWENHDWAFNDLQNGALRQRDVLSLSGSDNEECARVHDAHDKCAFVKANCADEQAGIFSYLSLYYCSLPHVKPVAFTIIVVWLALLFSTIGIAASDFFCVNLSTIATLLGMSESMAGVTFLAFGNGSPDVFSTFAAMSTNSGSLAVGELMGAAGFITAVVAGSMALVRPFKVARKSFVRDVGFFIVSASFSLVFLWDGKLYFWECVTMVGFYVFYVIFVMAWHWWLGRRRRRQMKTAAMRSHYVISGGEEEEYQGYHDDDDDGDAGHSVGRRTPLRGVSADDFSNLERAGDGGVSDEDVNEDDEIRERWLGELSSNMRLSRPRMGERRNTQTPIRPSLVGALEFRAVLSSLKKSRNIQSIPINLRRYSDDPTFTTAQQQDWLSSTSDPASRPPYDVRAQASNQSLSVIRPSADVSERVGNRARAVSTNDLDYTHLDPRLLEQRGVPDIDLLGSISDDEASNTRASSDQPPPPSNVSLSPSSSVQDSTDPSPAPPTRNAQSPKMLAPPTLSILGVQSTHEERLSPASSPTLAPRPRQPGSRPLPQLNIPSSPPIAFPPYSEHPSSGQPSSTIPSLRLPSPSASPESLYQRYHFVEPEIEGKPLGWWPYKFLPSPRILVSTLFPTLYSWHDKNIWERFLGIIAAPSVFLLTITLPVVETQRNEDEEDDEITPDVNLPGPAVPINGNTRSHSQRKVTPSEPEVAIAGDRFHLPTDDLAPRQQQNSQFPELLLTPAPDLPNGLIQSPEQIPADRNAASSPKEWSRWLLIVQAFTAPFFIVLIVWANTSLESPRALVKPTLYALIISLVMLGLLLILTTPNRPPRWRYLFSFLGFVVSISWISTIANEVVGVLKFLGVVLNMSDAILGLTIFAVGNSLGDLVADITVARLGFPVMALSACFGGPMLNILLGIGLSGCYITFKKGRHHQAKHPNTPLKFKPYHIDISTTLLISGATLLATLVGLLIAVPLRKWRMDKLIGWGVIVLWTVSTIINVIIEVLGIGTSSVS